MLTKLVRKNAVEASWLRALSLAGPCLISGLALAARLIPSPRTIDDAFITFRYARNILAGAGFVYNPGQAVLGTTTPFYTLLLAALAGASGDMDYPRLAWLVNALADVLVCVLLIRLGKTISGNSRVGLAAGALWAIAPMSVTFSIGGMETSIFILLLILSASLYLEGHSVWAALAAALLLLTRPDGILLVGPMLLDLAGRCWRAKRIPWPEAGVFTLTLAPWLIFATLYFGSPIPHSIAAKSLAYQQNAGEALVRLIQHYSTPFMEDWALGSYWRLGGFFVYLMLGALGAQAAFRRNTRVWPLALYPWLYLVVFAAANPLIFRWYLAPPLPFYVLLILAGLSQAADALKGLSRVTFYVSRVLPAGVYVFAGLSLLHAWTLRPDHGPQLPAPDMAWHKLELLYTAVGQDLAAQVTPQTLIAAGDVGALGYYTNARILDTVGLMSPEAAAYYPLDSTFYTINYAVPPQLILDYRPDYVVLLEVYGRKGLFRDADFLAQYQLEQTLPADIYDSEGMLVWRRR